MQLALNYASLFLTQSERQVNLEAKMRDPKRIYPVTQALAQLWSKYPDLRFFQVCAWISENEDWFYKEDSLVLKRIEELINLKMGDQ